MSFGTMPFQWIRDGRLKDFSSRKGVSGRSIAALKAYLAIASYRDYESGHSVLSCSDIGIIAGLSKPMVLEGTALLQSMELLEIELRAARNTNRYLLPGIANGFRKVPQDRIRDRLPSIGTRHVRYLDALKQYFAMLYLRNEITSKATASHKSLIEYTGVRPEDVAAANAVLAACHFLHIRYSDEWSQTGHPTNEYELLGDFRGQRRYRHRPTEERRRDLF